MKQLRKKLLFHVHGIIPIIVIIDERFPEYLRIV